MLSFYPCFQLDKYNARVSYKLIKHNQMHIQLHASLLHLPMNGAIVNAEISSRNKSHCNTFLFLLCSHLILSLNNLNIAAMLLLIMV